jgi:hypothetical protein
LNAVSQFQAAKFDEAIDTFIELDFNPAKVVALYPESVSGRLSVPRDGWICLYGGPTSTDDDKVSITRTDSDRGHESDKDSDKDQDLKKDDVAGRQSGSSTNIFEVIASGTGSVGGKLRKTGLAGLQALLPGGQINDDDASSVAAKKKPLLQGAPQFFLFSDILLIIQFIFRRL